MESQNGSGWKGPLKIYKIPGQLAKDGVQLSQRGERTVVQELAGLKERALK